MDNRQISHEPMDVLDEYVDVSEEIKHNPLMTDLDQLTNENQILKNLLSDLQKYVTTLPEIDDSAFEQSSTLKIDPPESILYRQAQDIYNKLKAIKEIERHINELENENQILKTLLRDLHMCATSNTEIINSPLEPSDTVKYIPSMAIIYQQAQDICTQLKKTKEIESDTESAGKQLFKLLSVILGDGGQHKMVTTGREKRTDAVSQSLLKQSDRHNENFQLALSELEQMKQRSRECETLHQRLSEANESLSKTENDKICLTKAWQDIYIQQQEDKNRELQQISNEWVNHCKALTQQHTAEKEQLFNSVEILKSEKDNLLTRLSIIAADQLTHGNVDIADLSDADRPTKLQEVYSELYDNEWTDAFEELLKQPNVSEKVAIRTLLDIIMCSFQKCREITWGRYEMLKHVASSVDIVQRIPFPSAEKVMSDVSEPGLVNQEPESRALLGNNNTIEDQNVAKENEELSGPNMGAASRNKIKNGNEMRFGCIVDLDINLEKQIKDIWRKTTVAHKENAIKQLPSVIETCLEMPCRFLPMTSKYLNICIDLCWKMGVQEKPLHLDCVAEKGVAAGKRFDKEKFRAYTHSGENVDFVVWPALFLYEGGPMLVKGIAQGCTSDEKENSAQYV